MKITFFPGNTQHVFNPRVILAEYLHVSSDVMTHPDGPVFLHQPRHGHPVRVRDLGQAAPYRGPCEAPVQVGLPRLSGDGERQEEAGHPTAQRPRVSGGDQSYPGGDG